MSRFADESYSTLGGSIYGNKAEGKLSAMGALPLDGSGDEVRYEGGDTDDSFVIATNPADPNSIMTVAKRALGGGLMSWYTDSPNDRYGDGDIEADPSYIPRSINLLVYMVISLRCIRSYPKKRRSLSSRQ